MEPTTGCLHVLIIGLGDQSGRIACVEMSTHNVRTITASDDSQAGFDSRARRWRSLRINEYSAVRFHTRLAISVSWTAFSP